MNRKRRHRRLDVEVPVRYRETLAAKPIFRGAQVKDLSVGGLRFQSETFLPVDTSLIFEFSFPESARPVRAISRVAWARRIPTGERYEMGSQFVDIVPTEKKILESFLGGITADRA